MDVGVAVIDFGVLQEGRFVVLFFDSGGALQFLQCFGQIVWLIVLVDESLGGVAVLYIDSSGSLIVGWVRVSDGGEECVVGWFLDDEIWFRIDIGAKGTVVHRVVVVRDQEVDFYFVCLVIDADGGWRMLYSVRKEVIWLMSEVVFMGLGESGNLDFVIDGVLLVIVAIRVGQLLVWMGGSGGWQGEFVGSVGDPIVFRLGDDGEWWVVYVDVGLCVVVGIGNGWIIYLLDLMFQAIYLSMVFSEDGFL